MVARINLVLGLISLACSIAFAYDGGPLQDFCVADLGSPVLVNGFVCKDPKLVTAEDFFTSGLHLRGNTSNPVGSFANRFTAIQVPAFNTIGLSVTRADFAPQGVNTPHFHPRSSEILIVSEGTLLAGFVTTHPENRLITKVLNKGDLFVFPVGLVHFQKNIGHGHAASISTFNSQNPGVVFVTTGLFGSNPSISSDLLAKAFQVDEKVIDQIQQMF